MIFLPHFVHLLVPCSMQLQSTLRSEFAWWILVPLNLRCSAHSRIWNTLQKFIMYASAMTYNAYICQWNEQTKKKKCRIKYIIVSLHIFSSLAPGNLFNISKDFVHKICFGKVYSSRTPHDKLNEKLVVFSVVAESLLRKSVAMWYSLLLNIC